MTGLVSGLLTLGHFQRLHRSFILRASRTTTILLTGTLCYHASDVVRFQIKDPRGMTPLLLSVMVGNADFFINIVDKKADLKVSQGPNQIVAKTRQSIGRPALVGMKS